MRDFQGGATAFRAISVGSGKGEGESRGGEAVFVLERHAFKLDSVARAEVRFHGELSTSEMCRKTVVCSGCL